MKYLSILFAIILSGCAMFADKPNNTTAFTSDQIYNLAVQVERAQTNGIVSEEKGDEYLDLLLRANDLLRGAASTYTDISLCEDSESKFRCIDNILATVEGAIQ